MFGALMNSAQNPHRQAADIEIATSSKPSHSINSAPNPSNPAIATIIPGPHLAKTLSLPSVANLHKTLSQFQQTNYSNKGLKYDKIVIGAIIIKDSKLLLLKHAAHEKIYPNVFELPSGNVDSTDLTLTHALAREVEEETGLKVIRVVDELLPPFEYETSKMLAVEEAYPPFEHATWEIIIPRVEWRKTCVQVNFLVEVENGDVKVNPEEHSTAVWADEKEVEGLEMTDGMRILVQRAFDQFVKRKHELCGTN